MTTTTQSFSIRRLVTRVAAVLVVQAIAVGIIAVGVTMISRSGAGLEALTAIAWLDILTELVAFIVVVALASRAEKRGHRDAAIGWLIGLAVAAGATAAWLSLR